MKTLLKHLFCMSFLLVTISINVMAQGKLKVQGIVTDEENGEPLIGVTVKIVGDNKTGVITDLNGEYSIMAKKGDKIAFLHRYEKKGNDSKIKQDGCRVIIRCSLA